MSMRTQIFAKNYGYGKLLLKTSSTQADWRIAHLSFTIPTIITVIDNVTNEVINQMEETNFGNTILADLSLSSGDCSLYVDVDDTGNGLTYLWFWYYNSYITYVDTEVIPMLFSFWTNYNHNLVVEGSMLNVVSFFSRGTTFDVIDFSNTTKLTYFNHQILSDSNVKEFDLSNNANLTHLEGVNYDYTNINVSNHLKLVTLKFKDVNVNIDANINNDHLPDLRILVINNISRPFDFNTRNLSLVTEMSIDTADAIGWVNLTSLKKLYLKTSASILPDINLIPNLEKLQFNWALNLTEIDLSGMKINELSMSYTNNLTILDLTSLLNLIKFTLSYDSGIAEIRINNGLNSQVTLFQRLYRLNTIDVKVDSPTDANNGDAPYSSTIWKNYLDNNSWNFI